MRFLILVMTVLSLGMSTAWGDATVSGYVHDVYGYPINGLKVCLEGPYYGPILPETHCDVTYGWGYYSITFPMDGQYGMSIRGSGVDYGEYIWLFSYTNLDFIF